MHLPKRKNSIYNYLTSVSDINVKNNNFTSAIYVKDSGYNSFVIEDNTMSNTNGYPFCVDLSGTAVNNDIYSYLMNENNTASCLRNGIEIKGNVSTNKTLVSKITYYVSSSFSVNSGAELNISDDTVIYILSSNTFSYDQTQGLTAGHNSIVSTDPKGNVVKKVYDKAQKLVKVVDNDDETVYNYLANGSLSSVEYESGIREEYSYYSNGQLQTLVNKAADETVIECNVKPKTNRNNSPQ